MVSDKTPKPDAWGMQSADGQVLLSMPWEIFVLAVAILSIVNLVLALLIRNPDLDQVIVVMNSVLIVIFAIDLVRRLNVADDNRAYLTKGRGWLDAISIFPMLRITRILRILRVIRVVGRMGGLGQAVKAFFEDKATGGLLLVFLIAILVMEFGSLAILAVERTSPEANITTASDALWYLIVTMSTVGYGDQYPVTNAGRGIGSLIIIIGVGVFGTLTGYLANVFLSPSDAAEPHGDSGSTT